MTKLNFSKLLIGFKDLVSFVLLISVYGLYKGFNRILRNKRTPLFTELYCTLISKLDKQRAGTISRVNLIELSLHNMADKKTRTWITMGGMALGIGLIVLLVSIGYGLEQLVIRRVARLEELKQADVLPGLSDDLLLTDKSVATFKQIPGVVEAIPVISAVGRISYNNSETDMATYGVTSRYLTESAIRASSGKVFESDEVSTDISTEGDKERAMPERTNESNQEVSITLEEGSWYRVRDSMSVDGEIIGYTRLIEEGMKAVEVTGGEYTWQDKVMTKWLQVTVPIWDKGSCDGLEACENGEYIPRMDEGAQVKLNGYIAEINIEIFRYESASALNDDSQPIILGTSTDGTLPVVEIASLSGKLNNNQISIKMIGGRDEKELVLNQASLKVLGLEESKAIGSTIKISFVIVGSGNEKSTSKTESIETDYTIVGVIADESTPIVYVPFVDLRSLGVENYSQIKIITESKDVLPQVRTTIESSGFGTISVTDTIGQIDKLFTNLRTFLAALGIVALAVAALGMFNTLTVSLLERTHEVGLMKAIGMKSSEVKELFMTESMIMGFFGGLLGLVLGILAGLVLSIILSIFAMTKGVGFLNITFIPIPFAILIVLISLLVGIVTGYVPARRATRISALDALRYE